MPFWKFLLTVAIMLAITFPFGAFVQRTGMLRAGNHHWQACIAFMVFGAVFLLVALVSLYGIQGALTPTHLFAGAFSVVAVGLYGLYASFKTRRRTTSS